MKYIVTKLRDAYVEYWTEIEADNKVEAINAAREAKDWQRGTVREYDDVIYPIDEVTRIDA